MTKPFASNEAVKAAEGHAKTAHGYEVTWNGKAIIVYDDVEVANGLAERFETYAKHSRSRFENPHWITFSLVGLPIS